MENKKQKAKISYILICLIILAAAVVMSVFMLKGQTLQLKNGGEKPAGPSNIFIQEYNSMQADNLCKLAKVWGFAKYYHPDIINGSVDWDLELFHVMPKLLDAKNSDEANEILSTWLTQFPADISQGNNDSPWTQLTPDDIALKASTEWISDEDYLGQALSGYLLNISQSNISERSKAYTSYDKIGGYSNFLNEKKYALMDFSDTGYRLLGLFRYWNIIEYYYPYKDILDKDWNQVLYDALPDFIQSKDKQSYAMAIAKLSAQIHDAHSTGLESALFSHFGEYLAPFSFTWLDGQIVVDQIAKAYASACPLRPGDIILSMDETSVSDLLEDRRQYIAIPEKDKFVIKFLPFLFRTKNDSASFQIIRNNEEQTVTVSCYKEWFRYNFGQRSELMEQGKIGYINTGELASGQIESLMKKYADTKGLVIDLRNYPSDFIVYSLAEYLIPEQMPFSRISLSNQAIPGEFVWVPAVSSGNTEGKAIYSGKVIILMNECTQSQAEFTVMSLRNAPNAVVIGTRSIGADGNTTSFPMPGGISCVMTGIGIYNPAGSGQTQRIGLEPDIIVEPTVQGISEGQDELLEKAVSMILEDS